MRHTLLWKFAPSPEHLTVYWVSTDGREQNLSSAHLEIAVHTTSVCKDLSKLHLYLLNSLSSSASPRNEEAFGELTLIEVIVIVVILKLKA